MARILPETPPQSLPSEVLRTFKALKALPDTFIIWHHLAPWEPDSPDFLIINQEGRTLLVKISRASKSETSTAAQMLLLGEAEAPFGEAEGELLNRFVQKVGLQVGEYFESLCVFPNIPDKQVQESRLKRELGEPQWAGRELLKEDAEAAWTALLPAKPLPRVEIERVRRAFSPEIIVPKSMTVRGKTEAERKLGLEDYLLDYDQERAVKADLELPAEVQRLSTDIRLSIINGVAGSGKTLILLYRLRLLVHQYPNKKFLVLTHNRPLIHDMESRFVRLTGKNETSNVEWDTFQGWCYRHWPPEPEWVQPLSMQKRNYALKGVWQKHLADTAVSVEMFKDEIDWLKDQQPVSRKIYLEIDRRGRGFALIKTMRERVFDAIVEYQQGLEKNGQLDWGDVPRVIWRYMQEHPEYFPGYDFILVDEAQFFAPLWFDIIKQLLHSGASHLFVVADPTQGFLGRGTSWKSLGLEARGRSQHLKRSYRTTRQIMEFAALFYRQRLPEERDDDILAPDMLRMPDGVLPQVISVPAAQDENELVAKEIERFVRHGYPKRDLLALHAAPNGADRLVEAIKVRLGNGAALNAKETYPGDYVRVTSLNAGAGLESAIVFVVGLRELFEKEQSLRLSDEEREAMILNNTRKLYMAITRAGQRLVFTYPGLGNSVLDDLLVQIK
jgi:superfamily I DNA/RNA helicase